MLYRRIGGLWCCRNCVARTRAQPCARCGTVREAATRDEHGRPLCPNCLITDPANQEECGGCGRRRPVSVRTPDGPLCATCRALEDADLLDLRPARPVRDLQGHRQAVVQGLQAALGPLRRGAARSRRSAAAPLTRRCARPAPSPAPGFWRSCPGCGQEGRITPGQCKSCRLRRAAPWPARRPGRHDQSGPAGALRQPGGLRAPATVLGWLGKQHRRGSCANSAPASGRSPTPPSTNCPTASRSGTCARSWSPPGRCRPAMSSWPGWRPGSPGPSPNAPTPASASCCTATPSGTSCAGSAAGWPGQHATHGQALAAQRNIKAAIALLDWLTARGLTLATARQGDLETWLDDAQPSHRTDAGNFVRWARRHKLTRLDFAATRWGGPSGVIDTETRWEQARWLLHDDSLKPEDRLAGLLVLLYAQRASAISRLTLGHVQAADGQVRIRLGREPIVLPEPLDALALQAGRNPPRPRRHRRRRHLGLAVPRRPARPADQRLPARRTPAPARHPLRPGPLRRAVPARHRPARRRPGPHARHPHHRRRRLAARLRRRLGRLRRRRQPARTRTHAAIPCRP